MNRWAAVLDRLTPEAEELVKTWWPVVGRWARCQERRFGGHDFEPDAHFALWRAATSYDPSCGAAFETYLYLALRYYALPPSRTAARHTAKLRRRSSRALHHCSCRDGGQDRVDALDWWAARRGRLDPVQAETLRRRYWEDQTFREIAESRGVTTQAVMQRRDSALARLVAGD